MAELRDGDIAKAVVWYRNQGRIHAAADRDVALQQAVDAWAADVAAGHETGLYVWRCRNVAVLNQRARAWMDTTGRLSGPELTCPGGHAYRAGDRVVTLAAAADGRLVTSQGAVITAVDLPGQTLTLRTDDGLHVLVRREEAAADRLDYRYATTVHRGQGSTTGRAHLFADGGGRELAYVAMPRARESTHVWTVADDLPEGVDDLRRDWFTNRTPAWAFDTALPDPSALTREAFEALPADQQARIAALLHVETAVAGDAVAGRGLPDRAATLGQAEAALAKARQARVDLDTGRGIWQTSEAGQAVRDLAQARQARQQAEKAAEVGKRWRDRHSARKEAALWAQREVDAEQRWEMHAAPTISRLDQGIARQEAILERAANRFERRLAANRRIIGYGLEQQRHASNLDHRLAAERDHLDGVPTASAVRRAALPRQLQGFAPAPEHEPPTSPSTAMEM